MNKQTIFLPKVRENWEMAMTTSHRKKKVNNDLAHTAKTKYRKFKTNIPKRGIVRPQSKSPHSCVFERYIYSQGQSAYSTAEKYVARFWEHTVWIVHRHVNLEIFCAVPIMGMHKWDFRCSAAGMSLTKLSLGGNNLIIPAQLKIENQERFLFFTFHFCQNIWILSRDPVSLNKSN